MQPEKPKPLRNPRYRHSSPLVHDDGSPILPEWNLHCLHCDYELTGLSTRRCPECGQHFDPHEIWVARRHREAGLGSHAPAYVVYTGVGVLLLLLLPVLRDRIWSLLPVALLPVYEGAAFFFRFDSALSRPIIATLVLIACIVIWAW